MSSFVLHFLVFAVLTALTQVGGLAYLMALAFSGALKLGRFGKAVAAVIAFVSAYGVLWIASSVAAPLFGRTPLPCAATENSALAMQSPVYCLLNRHYVAPELKEVAQDLAAHMEEIDPDILTLALDAGFPFFDGFPMLPHLSHDDGRSLDLAYYYRRANGDYVRGLTKSPIGYWGFEQPLRGDDLPCLRDTERLTLRWDMRWFRPFLRNVALDEDRTAEALRWLTVEGRERGVSRVFIEPHLAQRLGVASEVLKFQGCRAARHDDHIHVEVE